MDTRLITCIPQDDPTMFKNLTRYQRNLYGGFATGVSLGILFSLLVPEIWWIGIVGGILFGVLVGRLFANDARLDMEFQEREQRLSRRPPTGSEHLTTPVPTTTAPTRRS